MTLCQCRSFLSLLLLAIDISQPTHHSDLMQLIEEAIDGCWIGHRAGMASTEDSGIGSVYSPPHEEHGSPVAGAWMLAC